MSDAPIPLSYQTAEVAPLSGWQIVRWWEYRRPVYNGVVLLLGIIILGIVSVVDKQDLLGIGSPLFALIGVVAYGFCANVCYTGGWILDLAWKEPDAGAAARRRRGLFKAGLIFSCLVTSLPLWFAVALAVLKHL